MRALRTADGFVEDMWISDGAQLSIVHIMRRDFQSEGSPRLQPIGSFDGKLSIARSLKLRKLKDLSFAFILRPQL